MPAASVSSEVLLLLGLGSLSSLLLATCFFISTNLRHLEADPSNYFTSYLFISTSTEFINICMRNCCQFTCGRDAHGVGGGPAVGGQAVRDTNGCGQTFSINQALPYARSTQHDIDRAALLELREDMEQKQRAFHEFNQSAELWRQAAQFTAPCISFCVQRENEGRMFPAANLTEHMPEEGARAAIE